MKTLCGIQARMSSARLPGKSLLPLNGETVIKRVHDSAKLSDVFYEVVVLTSIDKTDDELCNYLEGQNIRFIRGSLNNVLSTITMKPATFWTDKPFGPMLLPSQTSLSNAL